VDEALEQRHARGSDDRVAQPQVLGWRVGRRAQAQQRGADRCQQRAESARPFRRKKSDTRLVRRIERLRAGAVRGAVIGAVAEVGTTLARFFPRGPDNVDELPDDISLGR